MPLPRAADRSDPANRTFATIALVGLCVMVPLVVFVQQFLIQLHDVRLERPLDSVIQNETADDPGVSEFALTSMARVKAIHFLSRHGEYGQHAVPRDELDGDDEPVLQCVQRLVHSRTDRLRFAIVVGEVHGAPHARELLEKLAAEAEPNGDLAADIGWLRGLYAQKPSVMPDAARDALISRHEWFGRLALIYGSQPNDPARTALVGGYENITRLSDSIDTVRGLLLLAGLVFFIASLVRLARGDLTGCFDAPAVGGSVYLESFVIFLTAFMALLLVSIPFRGASTTGAAIGLGVNEAMQWGLIGALAWPFLRGLGRNAVCIDLGLHSGEGWFKEAACGVGGFLADTGLSVAITVAVVLISAAVSDGSEPTQGDPSGFPMFEQPLSNSWAVVWISAIGAVIWAPIYEELMFRGCLYRYLHGKIRWVGAAAVSAIIFGAIHPYDPVGLAQVAAGGFVYALLREWRGSLIAPITAHCLHNLQITAIQLGFLTAVTS